ncbi:MAG TPA: 3-hydroxyacyl-CoA dehydrogenase [Cytophagales bacterium]|nr:3-hydroxyacyl-CoA dehydrogenase [Cytophagales bacterium]
MKILVVGNSAQWEEFQAKFGEAAALATFIGETLPPHEELASAQLVFDFTVSDSPEAIEIYQSHPHLLVLVDAPKLSLAGLRFYLDEVDFTLVGFNGLPGMLNRPLLEVSLLHEADHNQVSGALKDLGTEFRVVQDRVGMVTPRVVCMIINEAFYTVQEGTASEEDIDQGMKLGTNYPKGPFEWCTELGIENVYELLEAVYEDTKDERYKICPLMKRRYLMEA